MEFVIFAIAWVIGVEIFRRIYRALRRSYFVLFNYRFTLRLHDERYARNIQSDPMGIGVIQSAVGLTWYHIHPGMQFEFWFCRHSFIIAAQPRNKPVQVEYLRSLTT